MANTDISRRICRGVSICSAVAILFGLTFATGCNQGALANAFVQIAPGSTMVGTGSSLFVQAEATPTGVTWSIAGASCTGSACGTLTATTGVSVTYVAPVSVSGSSMNVTITATSSINSKISASQTLTIFPVYVQITGPANPEVLPLSSAVFTASVLNDPTGDGVAWSVSGPTCSGETSTATGCGTLSNSTISQTTFNAPPAATQETINVTATSIADPAESASFSVTVPKLTIFTYSPTILPTATAGQAYAATIDVYGNTPPYTFTLTDLPPWLSYSPSGSNTGTIITLTGTAPAGTQGTYNMQLAITDSTGLQGSQSFALTTYPAAATGNNLLSGSYAFYATGWVDGQTNLTTYNGIAYIGSFTADGNGHITGGEMDVNSPTTGLTSYTPLSGTYNIQYATSAADNGTTVCSSAAQTQTGLITLILPAAEAGTEPPLPITLAVSLGGIQNSSTTNNAPTSSSCATDYATYGNMVEFDDSTGIGTAITPNSSGIRASGPIARQNASVLSSATNPVSPLTGGYAFGMTGYTAVSATDQTCYSEFMCGPVSVAGVMTVGTDGTVSTGEEDAAVFEQGSLAVTLSGSLGDSGYTDTYGRIASSTITADATSTMIDWPTHFIIYAVSPQKVYLMSSDPYTTNTMIAGTALQQNMADITATPFSSTEPVVLYENLVSTSSANTKDGPEGQLKSNVQVYPVAPTNSTSGTFSSGPQYQNASGTYTSPAVGGAGNYTYSVEPNGRVTVSSTSEPTMYLSDTSTGFGVLAFSSTGDEVPGLWIIQPQTATALNPGTYIYSTFDTTMTNSAPQETGVVVIPAGGVPTGPSTNYVPVTGYDFTVFASPANAFNSPTEPMLYSGLFTGDLAETAAVTDGISGIFGRGDGTSQEPGIVLGPPSLTTGPSNLQGCGQEAGTEGGGFVISATSFACVPSGGSFSSIHVFQQ